MDDKLYWELYHQAVQGLPPHPKREDFQDEEDFQEALGGWRHMYGPAIQNRISALKAAKSRSTSQA